MVWNKLDLNINNTDTQPVKVQQNSDKQEKEPIVIPIVDDKTDNELGDVYCKENLSDDPVLTGTKDDNPTDDKPTGDDDDDGGITKDVDPDSNKISPRESIAIIGSNIPEILKDKSTQLIDSSIYDEGFSDPGDQYLSIGLNMLNSSKDSYFDIKVPSIGKKFGFCAEAIGEITRQNYSNGPSSMSLTLNSTKGQCVGILNNEKKNFDAILFFSGTRTKSNLKIASTESDDGINLNGTTGTSNTFNVYGAFRKEFKKKGDTSGGDCDYLSAGGYYIDDESLLTKTGRIGGTYHLSKWSASIGGFANWIKVGNSRTVHRSHVNIQFLQPKSDENLSENTNTDNEQLENSSNDTNTDNEELENSSNDTNTNTEQKENLQNASKKWKKSWTPVIDIHDEEGTNTSIGVEYGASKKENSTTKFNAYLGASYTNVPDDEKQTYHGHLGISGHYTKPINSNTTFKASIVIKDRFTFPCKDNIITGAFKTSYTTTNFRAYTDARYTKVPSESCMTVMAGVDSLIKNNWHWYAEGYYGRLSDHNERYNIGSIQAGVRYIF